MIALVEGAERQKTPNELALSILLSGLTLIFLIVCVTLLADREIFGDRPVGDRADRAARLPHSDDDRRASVGDRHRRHGSADPLQRHRHLGPRGRGGGRRRHAAARQDRHDHLRQPHGDRVSAGRRRRHAELAAAALASSLADETPEGRSIVALAKGEFGLAEPTSIRRDQGRALRRPDPHFRRRRGRPLDPQRRDRFDPALSQDQRSRTRRTSSARRSNGSRRRAARRSRSPTTAGCSASSI